MGADPTANGLPAKAAVACNLPLRGALPHLFHDRFIASQAALPVLLLNALFTRGWLGGGWLLQDGRARYLRSSSCGLRHLSQQTMMSYQSALENLAHVVKKVPSIRHLYRVRRGFRRRFGV